MNKKYDEESFGSEKITRNHHMLICFEDVYYYIKPMYEEGPQFNDKFWFMFDAPKIIYYEAYKISEENYKDAKEKCLKFDVIDMRGYEMEFLKKIDLSQMNDLEKNLETR